MIDRVFIKIVFLDNNFNALIDVLSLPVISAVLSSTEMRHQDHIEYHRGSECPKNLANTYNQQTIQYKLFEVVYQRRRRPTTATRKYKCSPLSTTPPPSSTESSPMVRLSRPRKRRHIMTTTTAIDVSTSSTKFHKELVWCIFNNFGILSRLGDTENRYCYVDDANDVSMIASSSVQLPAMDPQQIIPIPMEDDDDGEDSDDDDCFVGYMKIFSNRSQRIYFQSLNYRNMVNLHNHIIVYFNVAKYYQYNSENIFHLPPALQFHNINKMLANQTDADAYENLKEIENMLEQEVLSV